MKNSVKVNFTLPEELNEMLKAQISDRKRSAFVAEAIRERLKRIEQEKLRDLLIEGYQARREEDAQINAEWEAITLESWPEE